MARKRQPLGAHRKFAGKLTFNKVAKLACAELSYFWRPTANGGQEPHFVNDFPYYNTLFRLDAELRTFAKRKTIRLRQDSRAIHNATHSPKARRGAIQKILHMLPDVLSALYPHVMYSPYSNVLFHLAVQYKFVTATGVAAQITGNSLNPKYHERQKFRFFKDILSTYQSDQFFKNLNYFYRRADGCEKSLNAFVDGLLRSYKNGMRVYCVDLYLHREASIDADIKFQTNKDSRDYIEKLLGARKELVKSSLNGRHPILGKSDWLMVPSVGGYGEPFIAAWFFLDEDIDVPAEEVISAIRSEWVRVAGSSAFCRVLDAKHSPRTSIDTKGFVLGNKAIILQARMCFSYLAQKSYFIFPELPKGSDSFWRSERTYPNKAKKRAKTSVAPVGDIQVSRDAQKIARKKARESEKALKSFERDLPALPDLGSIAAVRSDPDPHEYLLQKSHEKLLVEKASSDDDVAFLKSISRIRKANNGRSILESTAEINNVSQQGPDTLQDDIHVPHIGETAAASEKTNDEQAAATPGAQIAAAVERHLVRMGAQPQSKSHRSDGAHEKAPSSTHVDTRTATERHVARMRANAAKSAIDRVFGNVGSDENDPSLDA